MKTPNVGLVLLCTEENIAFRNSNVPSVRIKAADNKSWVILPKDSESGMIVYVTSPAIIALDRLTAIRITEVEPRVAKAEAVFR